MKIGVAGWGVVGSACGEGFRMLGHKVKIHDPKLKTSLNDLLDTEIVFVCVPTPEGADGECDLTIVHDTIRGLKDLDYYGVIAL